MECLGVLKFKYAYSGAHGLLFYQPLLIFRAYLNLSTGIARLSCQGTNTDVCFVFVYVLAYLNSSTSSNVIQIKYGFLSFVTFPRPSAVCQASRDEPLGEFRDSLANRTRPGKSHIQQEAILNLIYSPC